MSRVNGLSVCCSELTLYILSNYSFYFHVPIYFVCFLAWVIIFKFSDHQSSPMQFPFTTNTRHYLQCSWTISLEMIWGFLFEAFLHATHKKKFSKSTKLCQKPDKVLKKSYSQHTKGFTSVISAMGKPDYSADLRHFKHKDLQKSVLYT